jgi:hypothetical protein
MERIKNPFDISSILAFGQEFLIINFALCEAGYVLRDFKSYTQLHYRKMSFIMKLSKQKF